MNSQLDTTPWTVVYTSTSTEAENSNNVPESLANTVIGSRERNQAKGIASLLCYYQKTYLQVLEGPYAYIKELMDKLSSDSNHSDVNIYIDKQADQYFLNNAPMMLTPGKKVIPELVAYMQHHCDTSLSDEATAGDILEKLQNESPIDSSEVADKPKVNEGSSNSHVFQGKEITMIMWPRFDELQPTKELMELCALLKNGIEFEELLTISPYTSKSELMVFLDKLNAMCLLELKVAPERKVSTTSDKSFFSKVKNFINRAS